jgi:hypothetical protein
MVVATSTGSAIVDLASGKVARQIGSRAIIAAGGSRAAAVRTPREVVVVDLAGDRPDEVVTLPDDVLRIAVSADGRHLAVAFGTPSPPLGDGAAPVAIGSTSVRLYRIDGASPTLEWSFSISELALPEVTGIVVADDGGIVAVSGDNDTSTNVSSVPVTQSTSETVVLASQGPIASVPGRAGDIDAAGRRLVTFGANGQTAVWDLTTGTVVGSPYDTAGVDDLTNGFDGATRAAVFRQDGSVATVGSVLALWRVNEASLIHNSVDPATRGSVRSSAGTPSSALTSALDEFLATTRDRRTMEAVVDDHHLVWAADSGRIGVVTETDQGPQVQVMGRHDHKVTDLLVSGDRTLLVSLDLSTVQMHDLATGVELLRLDRSGLGSSTAVTPPTSSAQTAPSFDGWTVQVDRTLQLDLDPTTLEARACQAAARTLTREEWAQFLPDLPYDPPCGAS